LLRVPWYCFSLLLRFLASFPLVEFHDEAVLLIHSSLSLAREHLRKRQQKFLDPCLFRNQNALTSVLFFLSLLLLHDFGCLPRAHRQLWRFTFFGGGIFESSRTKPGQERSSQQAQLLKAKPNKHS
jgi:hypothetical protein